MRKSIITLDNSNSKLRQIFAHKELYFMLIPAIVVVFIFKYVPLYGIQLAFKNMKLGQSIASATWVGLDNFKRFFTTGAFSRTVKNTISVGLLNLMVFPLPIILALLLHNCEVSFVKKGVQTITYIPNLISVTVTMSIVLLFCGNSTGFINLFLTKFGLDSIQFMSDPAYVKPMYMLSSIWNSVGYSAVIYLASLSSVNQDLVDASMIDGCSKLKKIIYVDLPHIIPTITILLIMNLGGFFNASTERMLMLQTDLNLSSSEIIGTYTYKIGILNRQFGYSAAVDLFTNITNFILLMISNFVSKKVSGSSLF